MQICFLAHDLQAGGTISNYARCLAHVIVDVVPMSALPFEVRNLFDIKPGPVVYDVAEMSHTSLMLVSTLFYFIPFSPTHRALTTLEGV